jgi:hypothetical protein
MRVLMWPTAAALLIAVGVPASNAQVQSPSPSLSDQSPDISDLKLDAMPGLTDQPPNISDQKLDAVATYSEDFTERKARVRPQRELVRRSSRPY